MDHPGPSRSPNAEQDDKNVGQDDKNAAEIR